jgi:DNA-binding NarL/FixJ family response regulator
MGCLNTAGFAAKIARSWYFPHEAKPLHWLCVYLQHIREIPRSPERKTNSTRILALLPDHRDRRTLAKVVSQYEPITLHFATNEKEVHNLSCRLMAPVILYDRETPGTEWRRAFQELTSLPHRPSVILLSRILNQNLWQELIRCGGHDLLIKPLLSDDVAQTIRLALSFRELRRASSAAE